MRPANAPLQCWHDQRMRVGRRTIGRLCMVTDLMLASQLTDRAFWIKYWSTFEPRRISTVLFADVFARCLPPGRRTCIEVGGFPGVFSVYFKQHFGYDVTLLDIVILPDIVEQLARANDLDPAAIHTVEADFLTMPLEERYDVVFSAGFIEHFGDPADMLRRLWALVKPGGTMVVTLPNFRGVNGLVQWCCDRSNLRAHNLNTMKLPVLRECLRQNAITDYELAYYGLPTIWLEPQAITSKARALMLKVVPAVLRRIPIGGRFLAPHIVLVARKPDRH